MADTEVIRGTRIIQNARDFFEFADKCLVETKDKALCSKRIFRYVETINRARDDRYFQPIKENRKIHQVMSTCDGSLNVRVSYRVTHVNTV